MNYPEICLMSRAFREIFVLFAVFVAYLDSGSGTRISATKGTKITKEKP
jgi:hypothetical protein